MTKVYEQFDAATRSLSAYVIARAGQPVGKVVIKYGNAATAFVQFYGYEMAKGRATGYGYDKSSAAVRDAARKLPAIIAADSRPDSLDTLAHEFAAAIVNGGEGNGWTRNLESAGFQVWSAL